MAMSEEAAARTTWYAPPVLDPVCGSGSWLKHVLSNSDLVLGNPPYGRPETNSSKAEVDW